MANGESPVRPDRRRFVRLKPTDRAPGAARRTLEELALEDPAAAPHVPMLKLLVSELVTNAVVHPQLDAGHEVELTIVVAPELTRVVVSDEGSGFAPEDTAPHGPSAGGGYGLKLLQAGASRWGTSGADGRFSVWFEIDHSSE